MAPVRMPTHQVELRDDEGVTVSVQGVLRSILCVGVLVAAMSCQASAPGVAAPVSFDTATLWFHRDGDSIALHVEIARTRTQLELGLAGRHSLAADAGMLFVFDAPRAAEEGFWMWETLIPLDVALMDAGGRILSIESMEVCGREIDDCPNHPAGVEHSMAVETNLGWFSRNGVGVGDVMTRSR